MKFLFYNNFISFDVSVIVVTIIKKSKNENLNIRFKKITDNAKKKSKNFSNFLLTKINFKNNF
jgi:hypothetical protein